jgi:hypothetical protein
MLKNPRFLAHKIEIWISIFNVKGWFTERATKILTWLVKISPFYYSTGELDDFCENLDWHV